MSDVLTCWKEIADYLGKGVRTVQRWEHELGLPVRRPQPHDKNIVIALPEEIDDWIRRRCGITSSRKIAGCESSQAANGAGENYPALARPFTILAVDDNPAHNYALCRTLQRAGFQVIAAFSGNEALAHAKEEPDAIVLDVHLPDVDGYEVCRQLKSEAETAAIPVVFLTATCRDEEALAMGRAAGATAFLFAPVDPFTLTSVLEAMLAQRGGGQS